MDFLDKLFEADFMPHGHCYFWKPEILWPHVLGDSLTALAYFIIPVLLIRFVKKRDDVRFTSIFIAFAAFILSCGTTHALAVISVWHPIYRIEAVVKVFTALISVGTIVLIVRKMPAILSIPSQNKLRLTNEALQHEVLERTRAEEEVRQLMRTLEQKVEERTQELSHANHELQTFASMVSHDLKQPLRTLANVTELISESDGQNMSSSGKTALTLLKNKALSMANLIEEFQKLSQSRLHALTKTRLEMGTLVSEVVQELRQGSDQWNEATRIECDALPEVWADGILMRQVWLNLLSNAIKYSRKQPEPIVHISYQTTPDGYTFTVRDNGVGFEASKAEAVFQPFKRFHHSKDFEGTGIGLAIVQRIIERHGGRVWAQSAVDEGASFHFTLPDQ